MDAALAAALDDERAALGTNSVRNRDEVIIVPVAHIASIVAEGRCCIWRR